MTHADPGKALQDEQARKIRRVLWIALLASQAIYAGMILSGVAVVRTEPLDLPLPLTLAVMATATAIAAQFFWRRATGNHRALHESAPEPGVAHVSYILAWVLDESIAIHGLLLGLLAFPIASWSLFSIAAFVLMLMHRPR